VRSPGHRNASTRPGKPRANERPNRPRDRTAFVRSINQFVAFSVSSLCLFPCARRLSRAFHFANNKTCLSEGTAPLDLRRSTTFGRWIRPLSGRSPVIYARFRQPAFTSLPHHRHNGVAVLAFHGRRCFRRRKKITPHIYRRLLASRRRRHCCECHTTFDVNFLPGFSCWNLGGSFVCSLIITSAVYFVSTRTRSAIANSRL
jgi:hypothetical protein